MKLGIGLGYSPRKLKIPMEDILFAEKMGFDSVWAAESYGSDAVSDWPLLNALLNTASGATWVSLHHGGGVGMGFSQHSGMVICCDGTEDADRRIANVLWNDPATGVMRHADAGYDAALACAREQGLKLPRILG